MGEQGGIRIHNRVGVVELRETEVGKRDASVEHGTAHLSLHRHRWMLLGIAGVLGQPLVRGVVGHLVRTGIPVAR